MRIQGKAARGFSSQCESFNRMCPSSQSSPPNVKAACDRIVNSYLQERVVERNCLVGR